MNLGERDVYSSHHKGPQLHSSPESERPITAIKLENSRVPSAASSKSDPPTIVPWVTPPSRVRTPRSSVGIVNSEAKSLSHSPSVHTNEYSKSPNANMVVHNDDEQISTNEAEAVEGERVTEFDMDSGPPTPNMDDTPYIRYALEQLTRERESKGVHRSSASSEYYPVERIIPDLGLGYLTSTRQELALIRKHRSSPEDGPLFNFNATRPLSDQSHPPGSNLPYELQSNSEIFIPVDPPVNSRRYTELKFRPVILRPFSMIMLSILCLLMIAALMFCTIYSTNHDGLMKWYGGIYGVRYFIFRFLPQILAAGIFLYVQEVMSATRRIMPFMLMAMEDAESRSNALFLGMFSGFFLWPQLNGPTSIKIANSLLWLTIFTIPLQSCLFLVIPVDGVWQWATVRGVAWTLVSLYILVFFGVVVTGIFFFRRTTGLVWDPRSLADLISLLPRSNSLSNYADTDRMRDQEEIRTKLALQSDRLGYWRTSNGNQGIFYCIGEEGESTRQYTLEAGKLREKQSEGEISQISDIEKADLYSMNTRFRHIPWFLSDGFVIFSAVAAVVIVLAVTIVSFLPSTAIRNGFAPLVSAAPNSAGFSAADFLYSIIPSMLGLLLYLLFQPLDMAVRKLQPWAELGKLDGATAEKSLLLEYTTALPIACSVMALRRGHYRVAALSLLSFLFILLPVLGGGVFFGLIRPSGDLHMIPNLPSFYIILTLLFLYCLAIVLLLPNRDFFYLPHAVDSLSEIFSFVYDSNILDDAAFRAVRTKEDLIVRLTAIRAHGRAARYAFGLYKGRHGRECLGIDKQGRRATHDVIVMSQR